MCELTGCAADHAHGDLACVVDHAVPVIPTAPDREPVVLVTAVSYGGGQCVEIDVDGQAARVRLPDLLDAVAAVAVALLPPAVTV